MKKIRIIQFALLLLLILTPSCESVIDDFFKVGCELDNTCEVTVTNWGQLPLYVDVTYPDGEPNERKLVYPGNYVKYVMTYGQLVAWAAIATDVPNEVIPPEYEGADICHEWSTKQFYVALCQKYQFTWQTVYHNNK